MVQTAYASVSNEDRNLILRRFGKHISQGQVRFLTAGHLDIFEGERNGIGFKETISGKTYIDAFSSAGCFNTGRRNQEIISALGKTFEVYDMGSTQFLSRPKIEFARKLVDLSPGDLNRVFFAGSGADAIEGAIKLARGATGRKGIISMKDAYHGHSGFSLSAGGKDHYKELFTPLMPDFYFAKFGNIHSVKQLASNQIAAIILETIQGEGGIHIASNEYLKKLREICDQFGILLIFDEVQTGFGRTGKLWACEHSGVIPDMMVLAKSISGGIYPNGAVVYRDIPILTDFVDQHPRFHTTLGGGSDLGCEVSSKVLDYLVEHHIYENARIMGNRLLKGLRNLKNEHPKILIDVRGRGLMVGIEYTHEIMGMLMADLLARVGVFAAYSGNAPQVMRFQLPLTINEQEIDQFLIKIKKAMQLMKIALFFILPLEKIPFIKKYLSDQGFLISISAKLRKLEFWK
jgi:acetylornithine/succinyldiaminopimelate/putrescine aminotransferase